VDSFDKQENEMSQHAVYQSDTVITNARVFDGVELRNGLFNVGITGGTVDTVTTSVVKGNKQIDASGRFLMPGLIDCHIHLNDFFNATDERLMEMFLVERLPENLMNLLSAGVTTIKSVGDPAEYVLQTRNALASRSLRGPRLYTTGPCFTAQNSHPATTVYGSNPWYGKQATLQPGSPSEARKQVKHLVDRGVDAIKIIQHGGCKCHGKPYYLVIPELNLHAEIFKMPRAIVEAIIDEAHRHGLKVTVHTFDEAEAIEVLELGADGLEHGVVNQCLTSDRVAELMKRNSATYVPTLWIVASEVSYGNLKTIADAGVRVALGTDSFCGHGNWGEITLIEAERMVEAGLEPIQVLQMATKNGADHLGVEELGMVAPGKIADLILIDGDPTVDIAALRNVSMVMKDGEVVVRNM
jgi:imidazolonepropionase-like amidohydrolase